jgi:hypothetical protein
LYLPLSKRGIGKYSLFKDLPSNRKADCTAVTISHV